MKKKKVGREVKLWVWCADNLITEVADQCGVSRQLIHRAIKLKPDGTRARDVRVLVVDNEIIDAYEYKDKVHVFVWGKG